MIIIYLQEKGNSEGFFLREMERAKIFFIEMINENYLSLKKTKMVHLDSSYSILKRNLSYSSLPWREGVREGD
jgi:hypothetical protein